MAAYLIHYTDFVKDLKVLRFSETKLADIYGFERLPPHRTAKVVTGEENFKDHAQFSRGLLVAIYNALGPDKPVNKFENQLIAARRTFALLYVKYNQLELTEVATAPDRLPSNTIQPVVFNDEPEETDTMPKSAGNGTKAAKNGRAVNARAAGTVAEFKQTRAGTDRAKVLEMMDGTMTPDQIAVKMGGKFDAKYVMAHAYCLRRDCGIGYELSKDGTLIAVYPGRRTIADAIKQAAEKRTPGPRGRAPQSEDAENVQSDSETVN